MCDIDQKIDEYIAKKIDWEALLIPYLEKNFEEWPTCKAPCSKVYRLFLKLHNLSKYSVSIETFQQLVLDYYPDVIVKQDNILYYLGLKYVGSIIVDNIKYRVALDKDFYPEYYQALKLDRKRKKIEAKISKYKLCLADLDEIHKKKLVDEIVLLESRYNAITKDNAEILSCL